jgi:major vault protein
MLYGPCDFCPAVQVEVVERREAIPLDENEGVYVRDLNTGKVRAQVGMSYMLKPNEELWEKDLPPVVEKLLQNERKGGARNKTCVVSFRAPHNSAVQVYDYLTKRSRVVLGPEAVLLQPDEQFTIMNLSGGKPKMPGVIQSLSLLLGPDFMTDVVQVETADHARLKLQLAYNWFFEYDPAGDLAYLFSVSDFVGDACKTLASRVRGAVARATFDEFHKSSADIIRAAVFGSDSNRFVFTANQLVITNIDIQSVEPVDQRTRDSLQKSVQLAIEITTKSQEAAARHEAERLEQEARGRLERQKIVDEAAAEKARTELLKLQAESAAVESTGQATAEAEAAAKSLAIEGQAAVAQASQWTQAYKIRTEAELKQLVAKQNAELEFEKANNKMEVDKAREVAEIEVAKFRQLVGSIGADTIASIAQAGPELQVKLLQGLGISSVLITDGASPVNLFNTAAGLVTADK